MKRASLLPPILHDRKTGKWHLALAGCDLYFPTRPRAIAFMEAYADQAKCLYEGCWQVGFEDNNLGRGFRFCAMHAHAFHTIHTNGRRQRQYAQAG